MFYIETITLIIQCSYNLEKGTPFSVYGENVFIFVQTLIIILQVWYYSEEIGMVEKAVMFFFYTCFATITFGGFATPYWSYLVSSINIFSLLSRLP